MNNLTMGMYKPTQKQITAFTVVSFAIVAAFTILLMVCPALMDTVYAATTSSGPGFISNISSALGDGNGLLGLIKGIANPIAAVAIAACALYMLFGSDPTTLRKVKTWMLCIIAGLVVVNLASQIATWASALGGSGGGK